MFTWTKAEIASKQRAGNPWEDWWYDIEPSLDPVEEHHDVTTTTVSETTSQPQPQNLAGDVDLNGTVNMQDAVLLSKALVTAETLSEEQANNGDLDANSRLNAVDLTLLLQMLMHRP